MAELPNSGMSVNEALVFMATRPRDELLLSNFELRCEVLQERAIRDGRVWVSGSNGWIRLPFPEWFAFTAAEKEALIVCEAKADCTSLIGTNIAAHATIPVSAAESMPRLVGCIARCQIQE